MWPGRPRLPTGCLPAGANPVTDHIETMNYLSDLTDRQRFEVQRFLDTLDRIADNLEATAHRVRDRSSQVGVDRLTGESPGSPKLTLGELTPDMVGTAERTVHDLASMIANLGLDVLVSQAHIAHVAFSPDR